MSKHQKEVRRERKKTDRARRLMARFRHPLSSPPGGSHIPHGGAAALAAAAVIAAGTQAYADPVRFDNPAHGDPGHFHWAVPGEGGPENWLDLTLAADGQPGVPFAPTTLQHFYSASWGRVSNGSAPIEVHTVGSYGDLAPLDSGDLVHGGLQFWTGGYTYYAGYGSYLPEGQPTYLGARFDQGSGWQYAWIGVVRGGDLPQEQVETFAWGYETVPGVPIEAGIPEPGTLALLAFGAVAALRRRRPA